MSSPEALPVLAGVAPIPGGEDGPVFPAPWSARAFALAVALNDRGLFSSSEWAEALAAARAAEDGHEPEAYWRAWMAALEELLRWHGAASGRELLDFQQAWRDAAERTPHGEAIELADKPQSLKPPSGGG